MQTLKCCYKLGRIKGMRQTWAWHFMSDVFVLLKSFWKWKFSNTVHCFTPFPCLVKSRSKGLLFSLSLRAKLIRYFMSSTCVHPSKVFSYKIKFSYASELPTRQKWIKFLSLTNGGINEGKVAFLAAYLSPLFSQDGFHIKKCQINTCWKGIEQTEIRLRPLWWESWNLLKVHTHKSVDIQYVAFSSGFFFVRGGGTIHGHLKRAFKRFFLP